MSHRGLFLSAAWFNILVGLSFIVAMNTVAELTGLQINPTAAMFIQITAGLIVAFGIAYALVARDPVRYRLYVPFGALLKVMVVVIIWGHWLAGNIPWLLPALATVDAIYAALFWRYYNEASTKIQ